MTKWPQRYDRTIAIYVTPLYRYKYICKHLTKINPLLFLNNCLQGRTHVYRKRSLVGVHKIPDTSINFIFVNEKSFHFKRLACLCLSFYCKKHLRLERKLLINRSTVLSHDIMIYHVMTCTKC